MAYEDNNTEMKNDILMTEEDKYAFLKVVKGTSSFNKLKIAKTPLIRGRKPVDFKPLIYKTEAKWEYIRVIGDILWLKTSYKAPNVRVVAIDVSKFDEDKIDEHIVEMIPEHPTNVLEEVYLADGKMVVLYMVDVSDKLEVWDMQYPKCHKIGKINLPDLG